ncbi:MAG: hypothetical protein R3Y63_13720 [Eubacteriales bacterium]
MKKIQTFTGFIIGISLFLACLCIFGWFQVVEYTDNLELTLQSNIENMMESSIESEKEEVINPTEETPLEEESGILLNIDEYPDFLTLSFEVAEKYAKFTSGDLDFREIEPYFLAESEILTALESYSSRRYDDHDAVFVENLEFHSLRDMENGEFVARVTFEYLVEVDDVILEYPSDYSIYFDKVSQKITGLAMN